MRLSLRNGIENPPRRTLLWKLLAAPALSAVCFLGYLGYTLMVFSQNNERLQQIQNTQFPTLVLATGNVAALDKVIDSFIAAVSSNEKDALDSARRFSDEIRGNYVQLQRLNPARGAELTRLSAEFEAYFASAMRLSEAFFGHREERQAPLTARMGEALATYRTDLKSFRDQADKGFRSTVEAATRDSNRAMLTGVMIALTGLAASLTFGLYVALTIKRQVDSVVRSFKDIAHGSGDLEQRIEATSTDEMGELVHWFNTFIGKLRISVAARGTAEEELRKLAAELMQHRDRLEELVKERTQDLLAALDTAESASKAKSTFLANISHEIRTPLNAILGFSQLLHESQRDPGTKAQVAKVIEAGNHLLTIINDVLDISKIEAGKLTLHQEDFSLNTVFDHVHSMLADSLRSKSLTWRTQVDPSLPRVFFGDGTRISQIVLNFASNAVKFTEHGEISLHAKLVHQAGRMIGVRIEVRDTGQGIPPDKIERIFQAFEQADDSSTRRIGGTGLGLAISRRLAHLMNGEVGVDSRVGHGSTFWISVPLEGGRSAQQAVRKSTPDTVATARRSIAELHAGKRVLVVEDNPVNQEVIRAFLDDTGLDIRVAGNGSEALDLVHRERFDLILMDVQMPVMDGLDATRALRDIPEFAALPIIALTANAFAEDVSRCRDAGMDDHLGKPVDLQVLYEALLKWLPRTVAATSSAPVAPGALMI